MTLKSKSEHKGTPCIWESEVIPVASNERRQQFRQFGWFLLITVVAFYPYHMVTNPDCFPEEGESVSGCEDGSLEANIAGVGLIVFVLSLIILGSTDSEEDDLDYSKADGKWLMMLGVAITGWIVYWIVSSIFGSEYPVFISCMTIGLIALIVISDWSGADSDVTVSKDSLEVGKRNKGSDGTNCVRCGANILSNHAGVKATKVAFYTPVTSWIGATVGMAVGGFAGLFAGSLIGGAKGAAKGLEHGLLCSDCKYK